MTQQIWLAGAAALAVLTTVFWYARREERVRGRAVAAVLRGAALFLVLGGLFLPALGRGGATETKRIVLLDTSRSMGLPASSESSRIDSALRLSRDFAPDLVIGFGSVARQFPAEAATGVEPSAGASRITAGLETARRLGADSVLVLSDGEWDDRQEAVAAAERLGLGVREINVVEPVSRIGLRSVNSPRRVRSGDTARVTIELFSAGPDVPDSVTVEVLENGRTVASKRRAAPAGGRSSRVALDIVPGPPSADTEWRRYEIVLEDTADPYGVSDRRGIWVEVTRRATGVVLVALTPDWEARQLLPVVRRASTAGAVGYVLAAPGRFLRIGPDPAPAEARAVAADARAAELLVVLGSDDRLPAELRAAAERQDRLLVFPGQAGAVAGTPVRLVAGQTGDWYLEPTVEASPISRLLAGLSLEDVPPLNALFEVDGPTAWAPLRARRDRQGSAVPVLTAGSRGDRRWVIATGSGYWRWSFRGGGPGQLYDRIFTGAAGWLLENRVVRMVQLDADPAPADMPLALRIADGVERLGVTVRDSAGEVVWRDTVSLGPGLSGPVLAAGTYELEASGRRGGTSFRTRRPFDVADASRELEPRDRAPELVLAGTTPGATSGRTPGRRPVWPFIIAAALLCAEWAWRRRIGLR